jgi:hypothetical protein
MGKQPLVGKTKKKESESTVVKKLRTLEESRFLCLLLKRKEEIANKQHFE